MKTKIKTLIGIASILALSTLTWLGLGAPGFTQGLSATCPTGTNVVTINANGSTINSGVSCAAYPVVISSAGTLAANTLHTVIGTCAFSASVTCTPAVFSGTAVFASATSYSCSASAGAGTFAQVGALAIATQSTTGIIITAATSNSQTVAYICTGT